MDWTVHENVLRFTDENAMKELIATAAVCQFLKLFFTKEATFHMSSKW